MRLQPYRAVGRGEFMPTHCVHQLWDDGVRRIDDEVQDAPRSPYIKFPLLRFISERVDLLIEILRMYTGYEVVQRVWRDRIIASMQPHKDYFSRFNLTILPTAIHSSTYRLPCLSQQTPCGETKTPSSHCSRGSLLVARFLAST